MSKTVEVDRNDLREICEAVTDITEVRSGYRRNLIRKLLNKIMVWCATGRFYYIQEWAEKPGGEVRVLHFAKSEREFNTACRQRVEWLDEGRPAQHEEMEIQ